MDGLLGGGYVGPPISNYWGGSGPPGPLFLRLCSLCSLGSQQPVRVADIVRWRKACSVYGKGVGTVAGT